MKKPNRTFGWLAVGLLALSNLFCSLPVGKPTPTGSAGASPAASESPAASTQSAVTQGAGTAEPLATESPINQAAGGLDALTSYQASLTVTASGQNNGKPFTWTYQISQALTSSPALTIVTAQSVGLGPGKDYNGTVLIQNGALTLVRWSTTSPCQQDQSSTTAGLTGALFSLLPNIAGAVKGDAGTQAGQPADHYTLGGGSVPAGSAVTGDLWTATQGGYLIQANLKQDGALEVLGPNLSGHAEWVYQLQSINQAVKPDLPASCALLLGGVLLPPGASNLKATDTIVQFTAAGAAADLLNFYSGAIARNGWKPVSQPPGASGPTELSYFDGQQQLVDVSAVQNGSGLDVTVTVHKSAAATAPGNTPVAETLVPGETPTPAAAPTSNPADTVKLISGSLNQTLGIGQPAPALGSFHLEAKGAEPVWNATTKKMDVTHYTMSADISGKDVHYTYTSSVNNGPSKTTDIYTVGGQSYQVVNGKAGPANPLDTFVWAIWSVSPTFVMGEAAYGATAQGSEAVASRPAAKYMLDTAGIPADILKQFNAYSDIGAAKGAVWIDAATGALLQADLTWVINAKDKATGAVLGAGNGGFTFTVSNIGGVTVKLP